MIDMTVESMQIGVTMVMIVLPLMYFIHKYIMKRRERLGLDKDTLLWTSFDEFCLIGLLGTCGIIGSMVLAIVVWI